MAMHGESIHHVYINTSKTWSFPGDFSCPKGIPSHVQAVIGDPRGSATNDDLNYFDQHSAVEVRLMMSESKSCDLLVLQSQAVLPDHSPTKRKEQPTIPSVDLGRPSHVTFSSTRARAFRLVRPTI